MEFRFKLDPADGWATPIVTGHKYKIHWGTGLDFEEMKFMMSENWLPEDESIYLVHNWTDVREAIDVELRNGTGDWILLENNTITSTDIADWVNGQHVIYNETEIRETHIIL